MYEAVMLRKRQNIHGGIYIKKFDTLNSLIKYWMLPENARRRYRVMGLTKRERVLFFYKCWSISSKK